MEQIRSTPKQQRPQAMQALMQSMPGYDAYRVSSARLSYANKGTACALSLSLVGVVTRLLGMIRVPARYVQMQPKGSLG